MEPESYAKGRAWIQLDLGALAYNVAVLSARLPAGCTLMPAVKADAYGHGAVPVSKALNRLGVRAFCVATADEGAALRRAGVEGTILILGYTHPRDLPLVGEYDLTQTVVDYAYAKALAACPVPLRAHLAVDTGMHRIGVPWEDRARMLDVFRLGNLHVTGLYTHLCADDTAREEDVAFTRAQAVRFWDVVHWLGERGFHPKAHLLGSYGLLHYPELGGDCARVGIALYGVLSQGEDLSRCPVPLRPVLSLKARVASVRPVKRGESVGYGLAYTAERDTAVATLAIGYADGLPRSLSCGRGRVLLHGRPAPILGRICMDQTMVDVGGIPDVRPGDTAVLIGRDGGACIPAYELADAAGTITNELLSRLGTRLRRICTGGS